MCNHINMIKDDNNLKGDETMTSEQMEARLRELKVLIVKHDKMYNEGGEGYNPYREESNELLEKWLTTD